MTLVESYRMLVFLRFLFTLLLIALITFQTNTENAVLRAFNKSNLFRNYGEAKMVLQRLTWSSIALYIVFTFVASKV